MQRTPIGPEDYITVNGRYLVRQKDGSRFFVKGLGFPVSTAESYNPHGWKAILDQVIGDFHADINTVRLYDVNCTLDYSEFLDYAASMGVYVMIPLTSTTRAVLNRNFDAPACYTKELFDYGCDCLDNFVHYPNVLAGVIANEVMNSLITWKAAPCIVAYARDLKKYAKLAALNRTLPFLYAAQHDAMTAVVTPSQTMKLTMEYLTCGDDPAVDMFGVNIESWCSSEQTYELNPTGHIGTYLDLHQQMENATVPLIMSEDGCSRALFNRDNDLPKSNRDWKDLPVIANEMSDDWSGFVAYAYAGNPVFQMTEGTWNGKDVLVANQDFFNFRDELNLIHDPTYMKPQDPSIAPVSCEIARAYASNISMMTLYDVDKIPSFHHEPGHFAYAKPSSTSEMEHSWLPWHHSVLFFSMLILGAIGYFSYRALKRSRRHSYETLSDY